MSNLINEIARIKNLMNIREEEDITKYLDSTYLKTGEQADISDEDNRNVVIKTIQEAIDNNFKLVMIRPEFVSTAREMIDNTNSNLVIGTVIDFPGGGGTTLDKVREAEEAIRNGVDELDYVADYQAFQRGEIEKVMEDIVAGTEVGLNNGKMVKWIIETGALSKEEIEGITNLISSKVMDNFPSKAQNVFVKTSTGFYKGTGATIDDVSLMKSVSGDLPIKASGGVYNRKDLDDMVKAGATRVGTSRAYDIYKGKEGNSSGY
tara:strand:+ start:2417 stop:3205 length:789 start_codon:yes stop_codon:yes gene_type:complete